VPIVALVDSGAEETLLPLQVARDLRLGEDELHADPRGAEGVGARFATWRTRVDVRGHLLRPIGDFGVPWGPELRLRPVFAEAPIALLGRSDFFPHFRITFETDAIGPIFHMDPT
jgi:hypothetical protein